MSEITFISANDLADPREDVAQALVDLMRQEVPEALRRGRVTFPKCGHCGRRPELGTKGVTTIPSGVEDEPAIEIPLWTVVRCCSTKYVTQTSDQQQGIPSRLTRLRIHEQKQAQLKLKRSQHVRR